MQEWSGIYKGLEINRNMTFEKFKEGPYSRGTHKEVGEVSRSQNEQNINDFF